MNELENELELLLWNYKFGIYEKTYFLKKYEEILNKMERLKC